MAVNTLSTVPVRELERLFRLVHHDPHSILGAHPTAGKTVVRAWRPEATRVELLIEGENPREMMRTHGAGFFELLVADRPQAFPYELRTHYPDGHVYTQRDPYTFLPTVGPLDEHLFNEGRHLRAYDVLGAHVRTLGGARGTSFVVWAPNADSVSVVGSFNSWDGRLHQMRRLGSSGLWEIFVPGVGMGALYKFEIRRRGLPPFLKADPYAQAAEVPPATSSIVFETTYQFGDGDWMKRSGAREQQRAPMSIYEVHLGSWRRLPEEGNRPLVYRETAPALADYLDEMNFTHVEFLPLKGHPYGGSWGYQVANYYAPTARYGNPDDFRYLVDYLHARGFSVIMDWVPAHFPKDAWSLGRFDGTACYEHADPRQGEHPDWGTYVFNYGRPEVKNFLLANALFWLKEFHIDGLRVDAVASMLYLDYSRTDGRWLPNRYGGRENLEAIDFLRELNETVHAERPGALMVAEESTAWPAVSRPVRDGGLGFDFKWNMGWMHDTLRYFERDPLYRRFHHHDLSFGLVYAWSENFILPFSHDEVVHLKGSLLNKMSGRTAWEKYASLRALFAHMWAHPGKQLLFMGGEIAQWREWTEEQSLDWHLLEDSSHRGVQQLVRDLNRLYRDEPALWEADSEPAGFEWIDANAAAENVLAYLRISPRTGRRLVCVCNFAPVAREYRLALPAAGTYRVILNTDAPAYGGGGTLADASIAAEPQPLHARDYSALVVLPPLATLWLQAPPAAVPTDTEQDADGEAERRSEASRSPAEMVTAAEQHPAQSRLASEETEESLARVKEAAPAKKRATREFAAKKNPAGKTAAKKKTSTEKSVAKKPPGVKDAPQRESAKQTPAKKSDAKRVVPRKDTTPEGEED